MEPTLEGHSAVGRLPVELLTRIFFLYASRLSPSEDPYHYLWHKDDSRDRHKVFVIAGVCRRWREVALTSPRLWCRLRAREDSSLSFVERILLLSRDQPLDITLKSGGYGWRQSFGIFEAIISNMTRIRTLDLLGISCEREHLQRITPVRASLLKKLAFWVDLPSGCTIAELEGCEIPSLEDLTIKGYAFCWDSKLLRPTLTHLTLSMDTLRFTESRALSLSKILDVLATFSLLQYLDLDSALPLTLQNLPPNQIVRFTHLRKIQITDDSPVAAQFLHHVIFPTSTSMTLACHDRDEHGLQSLFAAIADKWTGKRAIGLSRRRRAAIK